MKILQMLVLVLSLTLLATAQSSQNTTQLKGEVLDQIGAVIPEVKIVLTDAKGKVFETLTDQDGKYSLRVPAGKYSVTAEYTKHHGWEKFKIDVYEIAAGKNMTLDICLRVAPSNGNS